MAHFKAKSVKNKQKNVCENENCQKNDKSGDFDAAQNAFNAVAAALDSYSFANNPAFKTLRIFTFFMLENRRAALQFQGIVDYENNGIACKYISGQGRFKADFESEKYAVEMHCDKNHLYELENLKASQGAILEKAAMFVFHKMAAGGDITLLQKELVEFCGDNRNMKGVLLAVLRFMQGIQVKITKKECKRGRKSIAAKEYAGALISGVKECKGGVQCKMRVELAAILFEFNFVKIPAGVFKLSPVRMRLALTLCFKFANSRRRQFVKISLSQCVKESFLRLKSADNRHIKAQYNALVSGLLDFGNVTQFVGEFLPCKSVDIKKRYAIAAIMRQGFLAIKTKVFAAAQKAKSAVENAKESVENAAAFVIKNVEKVRKSKIAIAAPAVHCDYGAAILNPWISAASPPSPLLFFGKMKKRVKGFLIKIFKKG